MERGIKNKCTDPESYIKAILHIINSLVKKELKESRTGKRLKVGGAGQL